MQINRPVLFTTLAVLLISLGTVGWLRLPELRTVFQRDLDTGEIPQYIDELAQITKEVIAPPPLRGPLSIQGGTLTVDGVLAETNRHRVQNNAKPVTLNPTLNQVASNKINDMFAHQYFEHVSPDGKGPADIVEAVGYSYIRVGENLALGNFESDEALVIAWMNSPGHRTNMLSRGFTEIGIAVREGTFERRSQWLAVQTFATPGSVCSEPDKALREKFDTMVLEVETLQNSLTGQDTQYEGQNVTVENLADEINSLTEMGNNKVSEGNREVEEGNRLSQEGQQEEAQQHWEKGERLQEEGQQLLRETQQKIDAYESERNKLIELQTSYNNSVAEITELNKEIQSTGNTYNKQTNAYNECVQSYSK